MTQVLDLTDDNFHKTVKQGITLVDFWAPWCAPCKMQGPIIEKVAENVAEKATVAKVNVDDAPQAAGAQGIRAIPTVMLFKDGKMVKQFVGVTQENELTDAIENAN